MHYFQGLYIRMTQLESDTGPPPRSKYRKFQICVCVFCSVVVLAAAVIAGMYLAKQPDVVREVDKVLGREDTNCVGAWHEQVNGQCSAACGGGKFPEIYKISTPASGDGRACPEEDGATRSTQPCNVQDCAVDCHGSWGPWETCSTPCGPGTQTRVFNVHTPASAGGQACAEKDGATQTQPCSARDCPPSKNSLQSAPPSVCANIGAHPPPAPPPAAVPRWASTSTMETMRRVSAMLKEKGHLGYSPGASAPKAQAAGSTAMSASYGGLAGKAAQRWLRTHNYIDWTHKDGNWRGAQYTCINDQQQCGDCWANAITECLTIRLSIITGYYAPLDINQLIGCSASLYANAACDGSSDLLVSMQSINKLENCKGLSGPTCNARELACQESPACCTSDIVAAPLTQSQCEIVAQPTGAACCAQGPFSSDTCQGHASQDACSADASCAWWSEGQCSYYTHPPKKKAYNSQGQFIRCPQIPSQPVCNAFLIACLSLTGGTAAALENGTDALEDALGSLLAGVDVLGVSQAQSDATPQCTLSVIMRVWDPRRVSSVLSSINADGFVTSLVQAMGDAKESEITSVSASPACAWTPSGTAGGCYRAPMPRAQVAGLACMNAGGSAAYVDSAMCAACPSAAYTVQVENARQLPYPHSWDYVAGLSETALSTDTTWRQGQQAIIQELARGPVVIGICASGYGMQAAGEISTVSPVYNWYADLVAGKAPGHRNMPVNHAVLLVGYVECGGNAFWKIQNSWGPEWGDNGCFYVSASSNNTYFTNPRENCAYPLSSLCVCEPKFADPRRPAHRLKTACTDGVDTQFTRPSARPPIFPTTKPTLAPA